VPNSDTHAQNLLELVLDCCLDLVNFFLKGLVMGNQSWELASLVETRAKQTRNQLDNGFGSEKHVVLLREILNKLLVLVEFLQRLHIHILKTNSHSLLAMFRITQNANLHLGTRDGRKADSAAKTLVLLGVVLLQANLKLDRLRELARFGLSLRLARGDALFQRIVGELAAEMLKTRRI